MADVLPSQLANAVLVKLYDVLTNGDENVPKSEDNFFTCCQPGIPVEVEDFDFLSQGLTGVVKRRAVEDLQAATGEPAPAAGGEAPRPEPLTPAQLDQLRAQDTAKLYMQAENFARLVDFVPDVTAMTNSQFARLNIMNNEGGLSEIYERILRMSQVMQTELPQATKDKIAKFRDLLTVKVKKKNLIDDTETEVSEPSPLTRLYFEKMAAYEAAALEYNARRVDALAANDPAAVHYWALNANILRNRVRAAMSDWINNGYKNDYEQIAAFIEQVTARDLTLLKAQYKDELERARLTGLASGGDFYFTSLVPGNFARSSGWTRFTFGSADYQSHSQRSYSYDRWKTGGGGGFLGIFGGRGGASGSSSHSEYNGSFNADHFSLGFEICQVPIVRGNWFRPSFINSKTWRFDQGSPDVKDEMVSDGGTPPKGLMPAYPTSCVFIRNLSMTLGHSEGFSKYVADQKASSASGGGFLSFAGIYLGGSYSQGSGNGSTTRDYGYHWDGQTITVPGMQLLGYKCHILPKSPDPLPSITSWV
jgi:hypothetical protein